MHFRRVFFIAILVLLPGALGWVACGGGVSGQGTPDASSESGNGLGSSSGGGASGSGSGGTLGSASGSSGSGSGSSSGSSSSGGGADADADTDAADGSSETVRDVAVPDSFPADCGELTLMLRPDAAPNTCAFKPADVACDASSDCFAYTLAGCGCIDGVYGLNKAETVRCVAPPCPPPQTGCSVSGYETQDCQVVTYQQDVAVACVNHQCMTFAAGP